MEAMQLETLLVKMGSNCNDLMTSLLRTGSSGRGAAETGHLNEDSPVSPSTDQYSVSPRQTLPIMAGNIPGTTTRCSNVMNSMDDCVYAKIGDVESLGSVETKLWEPYQGMQLPAVKTAAPSDLMNHQVPPQFLEDTKFAASDVSCQSCDNSFEHDQPNLEFELRQEAYQGWGDPSYPHRPMLHLSLQLQMWPSTKHLRQILPHQLNIQ